MVCIVEFNQPRVRFNFAANKFKQKLWIELLLNYTSLDLEALAILLATPIERLSNVHKGRAFLSRRMAEQLGRIFLMEFSD